MKTINILALAIFLVLFGSCSSNRYLLTDNDENKTYLVNYLKEERNKGLIEEKPIIVVDGILFRYDYELKKESLNVSKAEITRLETLKKEVGIRLYGDIAKNGVVLLTTNRNQKSTEISEVQKLEKSLEKSKVLFILDDKIISENEMKSLDPNNIESIVVLKDKEKIKEYTSLDYDGVIIINLKK